MVQIGDMTRQNQATILPVQNINFFSRDTAIATGTQAITGVGFKPSYIIFRAVKSGTQFVSIGGDGSLPLCIQRSGSTPGWNSNVVRSISIDTGPTQYTGNIQSFDADGFTISWIRTGAATGSVVIQFDAFK